jgi:hypothetical protein
MHIRPLAPDALVALLRTSPRELSPALDPEAPAVVTVELDGWLPDPGPGPGAAPATMHPGIGAVIVGLGPPTDPAAALCDVVLTPDDPALDARLGAVLDSVERAPLAAAALVSLLRGQPGRPLDDGLLLESAVYSALQAGPEHRAWRAATPKRPLPPPGDRLPVLVEREGDTLRVTLDRPDRHNAYSAAMRDGLLEALDVALLDPALRVELRGAGPSFCSGGDLDEFGDAADPGTAHLVRLGASAARVLAGLSPRVTVHLHGACMGAGIELPAFAGRVVAAPDVRIALPELGLGLVPGAGGTVSLPARIGRHRTALLALTGEIIDAPTALEWGLVDGIA